MDCNDLNLALERYLAAEMTAAEEREFRRRIARLTTEERGTASAELLAVAAMVQGAQSLGRGGVEVNLHTRPSSLRWAVAAVCSVAIIVTSAVMMSRPTVYGYVNGQPITSLAEAQMHSERMFAELAQGMAPTVDAVEGLLMTIE